VELISKDNLDEVQHWMMQRRFRSFGRMRLLLIPVLVGILSLTLVGDRSLWRWLILGAVVVLAFGRIVTELFQRVPSVPRAPDWASVFAVLPLGAFLLATGGFDSPILPFVLMVCFFVGTVAPRVSLVTLTLGLVGLVIALAVVSWLGLVPDLMPRVFGGGSRLVQPPALLSAKALWLVLGLGWSATISSTTREIFQNMVHDAVDARDEVLRSHDAHARELTALSGELAHELKNPLANIKGLAVLASRDAEGKLSERLAVLQHEVTRMEEILQGFLAFSRPLSPISQQDVDLVDLCASVVALHEGMAHTRSVSLELGASAPVHLACDPRKVRQILINLLQNALEASAPGTTVELRVRSHGALARVEVSDRGPGVAPEARARLFEPGSTTKERGTGLGLALARGLARQHHGELTLEDRTGGGCTAVLTLPIGKADP